ncbi:hypothetical protein OG379_02120 [Streptomyces sp. NBC_01166]|uniref:hypothetical protein n=1 Tax=Streptomyces sp. NBC_01166 TaxID=2903755 RepID=UPI0038709422|nr:hypothetical protein OG379_02120 [Streptomyces sp. NBC_01166]
MTAHPADPGLTGDAHEPEHACAVALSGWLDIDSEHCVTPRPRASPDVLLDMLKAEPGQH